MAARHDRVVRQLQQKLGQARSRNGVDIVSALPELRRRIRHLQSLSDEFDAVRVSQDVLRLCASDSERWVGCA